MAKGQKSSASSATRKKHARKAAGGEQQQLPLPKEKKKDKTKGKNKEPRVKVYIPPSKPAPIRPDPLDSLGIAKHLPPELLVILKRLGKKDSVTKRKALESLQSDWVDVVLKNADSTGVIEATLEKALPVWLHHLPSLLLNASRRIRLLTAVLQASFLRIESIHGQIVYVLRESGESGQVEMLLGSWCMATEDIDRQVAIQAKRAWDLVFSSSLASGSAIDLDADSLNLIINFIRRALFDPASIYAELNPVQPSIPQELPAHAAPRNKGGVKRPPPTPVIEEESPSRRPEEEEESESDRKGRIRTNALGVLRWTIERNIDLLPEALIDMLSSPLLWTSLYFGDPPPFCTIQSPSGFLGDGQPVVRRTAWDVLKIFLKHHKNLIQAALFTTLSSAILRSAWVEPDAIVRTSMWEPLLTFLKQFPTSWEVSLSENTQETQEEDSDDSDEEDEDSPDNDIHAAKNGHHKETERNGDSKGHFSAYREFLQFLALGCYGSPTQGYPAIVVIISTIPPSILGLYPTSWTDFFTSFWAAFDGQVLSSLASLERAKGSTAFLRALLESLVFLIKRSQSFGEETISEELEIRRQGCRDVASQQCSRVWEELITTHLRVDVGVSGKTLAHTLMSLELINETLFSSVWDPITSSVTSACSSSQSGEAKGLSMRINLLKSLSDNVKSDSVTSRSSNALISTMTRILVERAAVQVQDKGCRKDILGTTQHLSELIQTFGNKLFNLEEELSASLDNLVGEALEILLESDTSLILSYLSNRANVSACSSLWNRALNIIATNKSIFESVFPKLLNGSEKGLIPPEIEVQGEILDETFTRLVRDIIYEQNFSESQLTLARRVLEKPDHFISKAAFSNILEDVMGSFSDKSKSLICDATFTKSINPLRSILSLIFPVIQAHPELGTVESVRRTLPNLFVFGFLLPRTAMLSMEAKALCSQARLIWENFLEVDAGLETRQRIFSGVLNLLQDLVMNVNCRPSPEAILQLVKEGRLGDSVDILDLFPPKDTIESMLQSFPSNPLDPTLAIVDPLIPPPSTWKQETHSEEDYDCGGLSKYSRLIYALLQEVTDNRDLMRENIWVLRHFLVLSLVALEHVRIPALNSPFFSREVNGETLLEISAVTEKLTSLLLSDVGDDGWHKAVVQAYIKSDGKDIDPSTGDIRKDFTISMLSIASKEDKIGDSRVLYEVMRHILKGATRTDAEEWVTLSRHIEKRAPNTFSAIMLAVNESGLEPPKLDRYRNEFAAGMMGVGASKANTDGLWLLHKLALIAPDPESETVFLPQNRAINFMKTCQNWISSDEDISEDVESEMTLIFQYLSPILQNVPGAHWEFIFDVIENNLENSSFEGDSSLVVLSRTIKLILIIQDLSSTNKTLRSDWKEREVSILTLLRDLVQGASPSTSSSTPRFNCWELAFSVMQTLPDSLVNHETLAKMAHLLLDPSPEVAKIAYSLLKFAARKWTEYLVVEAGVDTSEETKFEIPEELLQVLTLSLEPDDKDEINVFSYLLGWMIIFDLFAETSLRVKMGYAAQLQGQDLIGSSFLPSIFDLLEVHGGGSRPFQLEPWLVEEYYVQFYDPDLPQSPKLFSAHLLYRALLNIPSLISSWWGNIKDRQLLGAISSFITKHYSPVLISEELRIVKDPSSASELSGENWTIKVSTNLGEVIASYTVDDQDMEIAIRLPPDYPLHSIEIREIQKVGVEEKRWRGWLLAVQQTITSQNGRIVDGLSMFKKNVMHHFENQTECAICYSIISVTELSLPKKRCKTCRNRFHASCLYKWFNTSHSSSCPLCRSDFI